MKSVPWLIAWLIAGPAVCASAQKIDFDRDVQPILSSKCFDCHGPSKQLVGLRLDTRIQALNGGDYGKVILPGNSAESKLIKRVVSSKEGLQMPPTGPLDPREIAVLRAWIDQGADFGARLPTPVRRKPEPAGLRVLVDAIGNNNLSGVREALRKHSRLVNASDSSDSSPLMHAASRGTVEAMQVLLDAGAKVDAANSRGATALFWALGEPAKVRLLLDRKAKVAAKTSEGRTPLHNAVRLRAAGEVAPLLLAGGADANARDAAGQTPLYVAAGAGNLRAIELLLAAGAKVNEASLTGNTPLYQAATSGCSECVRTLMARGADAKAATNRRSSALARAAYWGDAAIVQLLIEKGAPVNLADVDGYTPLKYAAYSENAGPEVVRILLAAGADPKAGGEETALMLANWKGETEVTRILRDAERARGN